MAYIFRCVVAKVHIGAAMMGIASLGFVFLEISLSVLKADLLRKKYSVASP